MSDPTRVDLPAEGDPRVVPPSVRVDTWRDEIGRVWASVTGRRTEWTLGEMHKRTRYVRLEAFREVVALVWRCAMLWLAYEAVELLRTLVSVGVTK